MTLRVLLPSDIRDPVIDLAGDGAGSRLAALYAPGRPTWLRLNLVASVTGSIAGSDGTSNPLTNRVDRRILGAIRRLADVVLVGAETVRAEGYQVPKSASLAIVTGSGDLSGHRIDEVSAARVLVLCPPSAVTTARRTAGPLVDVVEVDADDGRMPPERIVGAIRDRGLASVVCEGGPRLAAQLVAADLVDELCLTTGPLITAATVPIFASGAVPDRRLALSQLLSDESGALFARWEILREP